MINGLSPWGNKHLIPRSYLREPLESLCRAHIGVIHHADLVGNVDPSISNIRHIMHHS
ncbi:hypothetical protein KSP39_PZI002394 [Platanthera zijinensis]|uniref:Uncharacterized protein n=1 Tax=Platanthera zijinensis TaxID=2320716 RepID=A0AAP0BY75_9ASPA